MTDEQSIHRQRQLLTLRVKVSVEHGKLRQARGLLEDWLTEHPADREKQFELAQLAWAEGDQASLQRAADVLAQGLDQPDRLAEIARTQALLLSVARDPDQETRQGLCRRCEELVSAYPDDRQIAVLEAFVAETVGDNRGAVRAWRRAIGLGEQAPDSRLRLAALLHDQGDSREALELCLSTASSNRDCRRATLAARILVSSTVDPVAERYAEDLFRETLAGPASPDLPRFLMELALLREYRGEPEQAIALTQRALRLQPRAVELKNNLAWFLTAYRGDHTSALQWIEQAIQAVGPLPTLLDTKGVALLEAGRTSEAVAVLESSVDVSNPPAVRLLHLAEAYLRAGRTDDAKRLLNRAEAQRLTGLSPRDRETLLRLKVQS
jgi:tetratricopeptide (TPR) repeat protein